MQVTENKPRVKQNALVLANASILASAIIRNIGEKEISRTLGGESVTRDEIEKLVVTRLAESI